VRSFDDRVTVAPHRISAQLVGIDYENVGLFSGDRAIPFNHFTPLIE
jgi:hypothetical protein